MDALGKLKFSIVILQNTTTNKFLGFVREVDGIIVQADSREKVESLLPRAIHAILSAKGKINAHKEDKYKSGHRIVEEKTYEYAMA